MQQSGDQDVDLPFSLGGASLKPDVVQYVSVRGQLLLDSCDKLLEFP